jgi:hypothetical protein
MLSSCKFEGQSLARYSASSRGKLARSGRVDAQFSAPWMGVLERVMFYSYLLWILVFAVVRLHAVGKASQDHIKHSIEGLQV